ncbi:MAG: 1-acyl-sn-glycerol-3-phosphate acyltransferase [Prolixibacteraceae bacterium]|nr:1-acyl-sn-glycerol-3-phosphate acyltransferase [Prolixibacteraceae bacterium]
MYNKYFPENEYHTPADHKRSVWDILSLGGSAYFKIRFLKFVLQNRKFALNGVYDTARWALSSYEIFKFVENCGGKFHITGFEHVDAVKDEPVVFISNHMSTLETMIFPCLIAPVKEVTFVVKDKLITSKVFGPIMRARDPIAVGRNDSRKDLMTVLNEGKEKLARGTSVIIFPQSTRILNFIPEEFNSLGVKLAQKNGVKIVPMAIKTDFWENGKLVKDLGIARRKKPIYITFGEPMEVKGPGKEEHQFVVDFIQEHLEKWSNSHQQ